MHIKKFTNNPVFFGILIGVCAVLCCFVVLYTQSFAASKSYGDNIKSIDRTDDQVTFTLNKNKWSNGEYLLKDFENGEDEYEFKGQRYDFVQIKDGKIIIDVEEDEAFKVRVWYSKFPGELRDETIASAAFPYSEYRTQSFSYTCKDENGMYLIDHIQFLDAHKNIKNKEQGERATTFTLEANTYREGDYLLTEFDGKDEFNFLWQEYDYLRIKNGKIEIDDDTNVGFAITAWYSGDEKGSKNGKCFDPSETKTTNSFSYNCKDKDGNYLVDHITISQNIDFLEQSKYITEIGLINDTYKNNDYVLVDFGKDERLHLFGDIGYVDCGKSINSVQIKDGYIVIDDTAYAGFKVSAWYSEDYCGSYTEETFIDPKDDVHKFAYNYKDSEGNTKFNHLKFSQNIVDIEQKGDYTEPNGSYHPEISKTIWLENLRYNDGDHLIYDNVYGDELTVSAQRYDSIRFEKGNIVIDHETDQSFTVSAWYSEDRDGSYTEETFIDPEESEVSFKYDYKDENGMALISCIKLSIPNIKDIKEEDDSCKSIRKDGASKVTLSLDKDSYKNGDYLFVDCLCNYAGPSDRWGDVIELRHTSSFCSGILFATLYIDWVKFEDGNIVIDEDRGSSAIWDSTCPKYKVTAFYSKNYEGTKTEAIFDKSWEAERKMPYNCKNRAGDAQIDTLKFELID